MHMTLELHTFIFCTLLLPRVYASLFQKYIFFPEAAVLTILNLSLLLVFD